MRAFGAACNVLLRAGIIAVLAEALTRPHDPRFEGKGIGPRGLVMIPLSMVLPLAHRLAPRPRAYPVWTDNLWLSIFALDLLGNHYGLYDRYRYFDAIPHAHGTGAATVVMADLLDLPVLSALGLAQLAHIALEAQEYYSDVAFGLHNVRGTWDTVNDLLAGALGSAAYAALLARYRSRPIERR